MKSETFGELIKRKRLENKMALREVSGAIEFDQSLLSKVERDKIIMPSKLILRLSKCLGLDYKELQIKYLSDRLYKELKSVDFSLESLEVVVKRIEKEHTGTSYEMEKKKLIKKIRNYFKNRPIEKVWLFGSFARNEEGYDSDIDLLVRFTKPNRIDLFDYIGIRQDLEDLTGRQVDLVEEGQELEKIKPIITKERKLIYERKAV